MHSLRNLSLKQLQAVAAIARHGTITKAAEELRVTPAALTLRIKQFESEAGCALFDRTSGGLLITDAGREVLSAVDSIQTIIETCAERLNAAKGMIGGHVAIGVVSTAKYYAPRAIAAFAKANPTIEIRLSVGNRENTIKLLRDRDVDIAIMGRPPKDFGVEAQPFGKHPFVFIASPGHHLARRKDLTRKDLMGESFLVREGGSGTRNIFEQFTGEAAPKRPQFSVEIGSNETIKQAVMAELGVALISAHTIATEVETGRLVILDVRGFPIWRQWFAVRRADKTFTLPAKAFWNFMVTEGEKWIPRLRSRKLHAPGSLR